MKVLLLAVPALFLSLVTLADELPIFGQYPATVESELALGEVDFASAPDSELFSSRLSSYAGRPANFAGHYLWVQMGCGTACQANLLVDLKTGEPVEQIVSSMGICHFADSRLLVVNPNIPSYYDDGQVPDWLETTYYVLEQGSLKELDKSQDSLHPECDD